MLWYKGWFETRFKLAFSLGFMCLLLIFVHSQVSQKVQSNGLTRATLAAVLSPSPILLIVACAWLAGAGVVTQSAFRSVKGLHGSTLFTLSLPVSRLRLLAVRAGIGWLELAGVAAFLCTGFWLVVLPIRATISPHELVQYFGTLLACISAFYFLSVLLSTFLEDQWRIWSTMMALFVVNWLSNSHRLPAFADLFFAMGKGSPLIIHGLPWQPMAFSLSLSASLLIAALAVVQRREY